MVPRRPRPLRRPWYGELGALPALFHNLRGQVSSCWLGGGEGRWEDHLAWSGGGTQLPLRPRPLRPMPTHRPPASPRLHLLHLLAGCRRSRLQDSWDTDRGRFTRILNPKSALQSVFIRVQTTFPSLFPPFPPPNRPHPPSATPPFFLPHPQLTITKQRRPSPPAAASTRAEFCNTLLLIGARTGTGDGTASSANS